MAIAPALLKVATFPTIRFQNAHHFVSISRTTGGVPEKIVRFLTFAWGSDMAFVATLPS